MILSSAHKDIISAPSTPIGEGLSDFHIAINQFYASKTGVLSTYNTKDTTNYQPVTLLYQSWAEGTIAYCPVTTTYVASTVFCVDSSCSTTESQPSKADHPNPNIENLGFTDPFMNFTNAITYVTTNLFIGPNNMRASSFEMYIADPDSAAMDETGPLSMSGVSIDDFSSRFQQPINLMWYGGYNPSAFMGADILSGDMVTTVQGEFTNTQLIYKCALGWLFVLLFASLLMLVATGTGFWFQLGRMKVRLVDVEGECEFGYVAIAEDVGEFQYGLTRGRFTGRVCFQHVF